MSKREWKVGGKYRLVDVVGFTERGYPNRYIADKLGSSEFTVESLRNCDTGVETLVEFPPEGLEWGHWFNDFEIKYFEEITEDVSEPEQYPTQDNTSAVVEWLDKLVYVMARDYTVNEIYRASDTDMEIFSDCGNITGNQNVAEFINNRYSQLIEQANKAKREELLAEIVKAKEVYEKLVGELNELEGK